MKLWCDNKSAITLPTTQFNMIGPSIVEIDRFFIRERIDNGI